MTRKEFADACSKLNKLEESLKLVQKVREIVVNDTHDTVGVSVAGVSLTLYSDDIISALISKRDALQEHINNLYDMLGISGKEDEDEK